MTFSLQLIKGANETLEGKTEKKTTFKYNFSVSHLSLSFSTFIALVPPKACSYNYLVSAL